jgi:hypothetical protein
MKIKFITFIKKIYNFVKQCYNKLKNWILSPIYKKRYGICLKCEELSEDYLSCNDCHCYLPIKVKLSFSKCPKKKW